MRFGVVDDVLDLDDEGFGGGLGRHEQGDVDADELLLEDEFVGELEESVDHVGVQLGRLGDRPILDSR